MTKVDPVIALQLSVSLLPSQHLTTSGHEVMSGDLSLIIRQSYARQFYILPHWTIFSSQRLVGCNTRFFADQESNIPAESRIYIDQQSPFQQSTNWKQQNCYCLFCCRKITYCFFISEPSFFQHKHQTISPLLPITEVKIARKRASCIYKVSHIACFSKDIRQLSVSNPLLQKKLNYRKAY